MNADWHWQQVVLLCMGGAAIAFVALTGIAAATEGVCEMFKRKKKAKPPPLPDPVVVALRDLEMKLTEVQAAALAAKWQTMYLRDENRELRKEVSDLKVGIGTAMIGLRRAIEQKRTIKVPLTLTVSK